MSGRTRRHATLLAIVTGTLIFGVAAVCGSSDPPPTPTPGSGSQDVGKHAVDFTKITPIPRSRATFAVPNYNRTPDHCLAPEDERPSPGLPPLSCRDTSAEPASGKIPTVDPSMRAAAPAPRPGFKVVDNPLFRLRVEIPDTWYSNMRPEGGQFAVMDAIGAEEAGKHTTTLPGGIAISITGRNYQPSAIGVSEYETRLESPTTTIGGQPGVIYDKGMDERGSRWIAAAFLRFDVIFIVNAYVDRDGRSQAEIQADIDTVMAILGTITTY